MTQEEFDKMISAAKAPAVITDEHVEGFIDATLDKAALQLPAKGRKPVWRRARWPALSPVLRFALPMVAAVILGVTVSRHYEQDWPVDQFSLLYLSTTLVPVGS